MLDGLLHAQLAARSASHHRLHVSDPQRLSADNQIASVSAACLLAVYVRQHAPLHTGVVSVSKWQAHTPMPPQAVRPQMTH